MTQPSDLEARVAALESRIEEVASDATAARHLAAARDRDLADLTIKADANRAAINALGLQTAARFDQVDRRFDRLDRRFDRVEEHVDSSFTEIRGRLDQAAAGQQQIADMLTTLIERRDEP